MAIQLTQTGMQTILSQALKNVATVTSVTYIFFTNNYTPTYSSTTSNFTQVSTSLVPTQAVSASAWLTPTSSTNTSTIAGSSVTLTVSGACTLYGYYVTDGSSNLLWAELFSSGPLTYPSAGGTITFTPSLQIQSPI